MTKTDTEAIRGALDALNRVFVTNSRDWAANRTEAWLWGIVVGWDNDGLDGDESAIAELAARFGWNEAAVAQLRAERAGFAQIEQLLTEVAELRAFAEAADTSGVTRDQLAKRSRRQLVDTVLAQAGQVRLLQQEWAQSEAELARVRAEADDHLSEAASLAAVVQQLDEQVADVLVERDQLRAELARVRADVTSLTEQIETEVAGAFRETGPGLDLTAIRNAVKADDRG